MTRSEKVDHLRNKYKRIHHHLNEKTRRLWAGTEAEFFGVVVVIEATGLSPKVVVRGRREIIGNGDDIPLVLCQEIDDG